jgi:putative ABC transport system permease protein
MDVIARQLAQEYPDMAPGIAVVPIHDEVARRAMQKGTSRTLLLLLGIAVSVLLIACLHVASLLVARAATREQEIAVRAALGAHRLRLVRQMLTESVLLAAAAGLLGVLLAYWGLQIFGALRGRTIPWFLGPGSYGVIPWFVHVRMDGRVLLYAAGVSLLTCSFFGVLPALGATALNLSRSLSAGRTRTAGPRFQRLRGLLVIGDIALAFILLLGAGLLLNSFARILAIDFGYNPQDVVSVSVPLYDLPAYSQPQAEAAFIQEVVRRVQRLPGVRTVAIGSSPVRGTGNIGAFKIEGVFSEEKRYRYPDWDARLPDKSYLWLPLWWVSPEYFRILQIPLLKGRCFTEQDGAGSPPVAIVSEALARRFWPNGSPIGKYLTQAPQDSKSAPIPREIVGVVATLTHLGRSEPADQEVYAPASQFGEVDFLIRTDPGRKDVAAAVRREILALDRDVIIGTMAPLEEEIADFFAPQRFVLLCVGGFAVVALVLACLGVYGTTAYAVSQRTHEIGIRVALGARSRDILRAVLGQGLRFTLAGLALGCAGALVATRIIRSFLYEVSPTDPLTFACVALVLAGVALLASYLPARRAAKTDPMTALRYE